MSKIICFTKCLLTRNVKTLCVLSNHSSSSSVINKNDSSLEDFDSMLARRRHEAQRSIVVQVSNAKAAENVWQECASVGQVTSIMHYTTCSKHINNQKNLLLVEFAESASVQEMLLSCNTSNVCSVPARSLFFHHIKEDSSSLGNSDASHVSKPSGRSPVSSITVDDCEHNSPKEITAVTKKRNRDIEMPKVFREELLPEKVLIEKLSQCDTVSDQMQLYYNSRKLSDLGSRLRFITCRQVEQTLSGPLPHLRAVPFGSSVNGFGHYGSDLDMVLELEGEQRSGSKVSRLVFQSPCEESLQQRAVSHRYLQLVADLLQTCTPGCQQIIKILKARVPIIKYNQQLTGLECDLSTNNWSGLYMSELLYQYCALDCRVGPLVFCLRLWASRAGLTSPHPGRWITNFSLTALALYYLVAVRVLPPLQLLQQHARPQDKRIAEDGLDCTFLRSLAQLRRLHQQPPDVAELSMEELLQGFFSFYDQFDFAKRAMSIITGKDFTKPVYSAIYIQNPLDMSLNVSRNVTLEEAERISVAISWARHALCDVQPQACPNWGLLSLWLAQERKQQQGVKIAVDWSQIFSKTPSTSNASVDLRPDTREGATAVRVRNHSSSAAVGKQNQRRTDAGVIGNKKSIVASFDKNNGKVSKDRIRNVKMHRR